MKLPLPITAVAIDLHGLAVRVIPFLPYWYEGLDIDAALRALLAHADPAPDMENDTVTMVVRDGVGNVVQSTEVPRQLYERPISHPVARIAPSHPTDVASGC